MSIELISPIMQLLMTENETLRSNCHELCETVESLQTNIIVMSTFIKSIYDFSGNIPSFANCINISTYDACGNIISCVSSDEFGTFLPCDDLSKHIIPCVLPPDLSGNGYRSSDCSMNRSRYISNLDYPYYGSHLGYPYYGSHWNYPYYGSLYDNPWRSADLKPQPNNDQRELPNDMPIQPSSKSCHYPYFDSDCDYPYFDPECDYPYYNLLLNNNDWRSVELKPNSDNSQRALPNHMSIHPSSKDIELPNLERDVNERNEIRDYPHNPHNHHHNHYPHYPYPHRPYPHRPPYRPYPYRPPYRPPYRQTPSPSPSPTSNNKPYYPKSIRTSNF